MATMKTHISWTNSTWNPTTGCTKVSAGCDHCYAEALTNRLFGGGFEVVKSHPKRLTQAHGFQPLRNPDGSLTPRMVFVNSMSDLMHDDIADTFRDSVFDAMEGEPRTIFQVLTKRPMTLRRYIEARYGNRGIPAHLWFGASVEDNRVKGRVDMLRRLKDACGEFTAFLSVEPLIGAADKHDYTRIDWVLIGGESGPKARPMAIEWARSSRDEARRANAAVWFKQFGQWTNNPLYRAANAKTHRERIEHAVRAGERQVAEKGGATLDGEVLHELPPHFHALKAELNRQPARMAV